MTTKKLIIKVFILIYQRFNIMQNIEKYRNVLYLYFLKHTISKTGLVKV